MKITQFKDKIGEHICTSDWCVIDQERIDRFADTTEDHQFIHVDPEAAKNTPFGQTIAHGFLTLSMLSLFLNGGFPKFEGQNVSLNYGFDGIRFVAPVKSGQRIRGIFKLVDCHERHPGQWQVTTEVTVEIEGEEKPALIANWILLVLMD